MFADKRPIAFKLLGSPIAEGGNFLIDVSVAPGSCAGKLKVIALECTLYERGYTRLLGMESTEESLWLKPLGIVDNKLPDMISFINAVDFALLKIAMLLWHDTGVHPGLTFV